jgi:hypothetical protein
LAGILQTDRVTVSCRGEVGYAHRVPDKRASSISVREAARINAAQTNGRTCPALDAGFFILGLVESRWRLQIASALRRERRRSDRKQMMGTRDL